MNYEQARSQIKTGDMLLFRNHVGGGLRATIERWFVSHGTGSPYTHVGVAWSEHGRVWIMDITTKGCAPRLLSSAGDFDWAPAPTALNEQALEFAFDGFGELTYSRIQAVLAELGLLKIGADMQSECAEYALTIWRKAGMPPTDKATPAACAEGAMLNWGASITAVENGGRK